MIDPSEEGVPKARRLLGLTGGYCAGKNLVAEILTRWGWKVIDLDKLGHGALEEAREAVIARYGQSVLDGRGGLDRKAIGAIVFKDARALEEYEAIVHPAMYRLLEREIERAGPEARVCLNAAILYKSPYLSRCGLVIEVRSSILVRIARGKARDGLGTRRIFSRMARQAGMLALRGNAPCPVAIIRNDRGETELEEALREYGLDRFPGLPRESG